MRSEGELTGIKAVVLAGGKGTRLAPYTTIFPKPLMPVGDMPVLEIVIRQLRRAGIRDIALSVGYLASLLEAYFGHGSRWGVSIRYSQEETPLGTAGPLRLVMDLTDTFLVMNGDLLTTLDFAEMVRVHRRREAVATVGLFRRQVPIDFGVIATDGDDWITGYDEKPTLTYEVSVGVYVLEPLVLDYIPCDRKFDLPDLVRALIGANQRVVGYRFDGYWLDIGRQEDYARAIELFETKRAVFLGPEP